MRELSIRFVCTSVMNKIYKSNNLLLFFLQHEIVGTLFLIREIVVFLRFTVGS